MTDHLPDSPYIAPLCPYCHPEADPKEYAIQVCSVHQPKTPGLDDELVKDPDVYLGSTSDAEAVNCRAIQALITKRAKT